jgi:hypothetical protein
MRESTTEPANVKPQLANRDVPGRSRVLFLHDMPKLIGPAFVCFTKAGRGFLPPFHSVILQIGTLRDAESVTDRRRFS